nr:MAG TPA: hypothetical protein [Caudoviricetes sp.]
MLSITPLQQSVFISLSIYYLSDNSICLFAPFSFWLISTPEQC